MYKLGIFYLGFLLALNGGLCMINAWGDSLCGYAEPTTDNPLRMHGVKTAADGTLEHVYYTCPSSFFKEQATQTGTAGKVCVTYSSLGSTLKDDTILLSDCVVTDVYCTPDSYFRSNYCGICPHPASGGCSSAADCHYAGMISPIWSTNSLKSRLNHVETEAEFYQVLDSASHTNGPSSTGVCPYCAAGYYNRSVYGCSWCPSGGKTDGDGHLGIERCYIQKTGGTDESGTYVYAKCYYSN